MPSPRAAKLGFPDLPKAVDSIWVEHEPVNATAGDLLRGRVPDEYPGDVVDDQPLRLAHV